MKLRTLVDKLTTVMETYGEDCEVQLVTQPSRRPLAYDLDEVRITDQGDEDKSVVVVHLMEGSQLGYVDSDDLDNADVA